MTIHQGQVQECRNVFISWRWAVSFMLTALLSIAGVAWAGGVRLEHIRNQNITTNDAVRRLEIRVSKLEKIDNKIDTLLTEVRRLK